MKIYEFFNYVSFAREITKKEKEAYDKANNIKRY